jgi:hypothetical protein
MAYHIAYLAKAYNIPPSLVVNSDKIDIHLVPKSGKCTWENSGSKHIHVFGIKNKRQLNVVVFSFTTRPLLPLQMIFTRTMPRTLLPNIFFKNNVCGKQVGSHL